MSKILKIEGLRSQICEQCPVRGTESDSTFQMIMTIIMQSGIVKLSKTLPNGEKKIIGLLFANDFLGHVFSQTSNYCVEAANEAYLCGFPKKKFEDLLVKYRHLEKALLKKTMEDFEKSRNWHFSIAGKTALEKVSKMLIFLSGKSYILPSTESEYKTLNARFILPLSRLEIADYLGTTHETISRCFSKLKDLEIIKYIDKNIIEVSNLSELKKIAEESDKSQKDEEVKIRQA